MGLIVDGNVDGLAGVQVDGLVLGDHAFCVDLIENLGTVDIHLEGVFSAG